MSKKVNLSINGFPVEIEQGKTNLNLEKVNQVLKMFGHILVPISENELNNQLDETS